MSTVLIIDAVQTLLRAKVAVIDTLSRRAFSIKDEDVSPMPELTERPKQFSNRREWRRAMKGKR